MIGDSVRIMGILNVTPDSFSDGGSYTSLEAALAQAERLIEDGADILDVGGESTRPFAAQVSGEEELRRVIPLIEAVRRRHAIPISVDTTKAIVAREALRAGADIINDISSLRYDPEMIAVVRETEVPVIIMHMLGNPADMQIKPQYRDVVTEVVDFLAERIDWITSQGVARERLIVDPGIGFGKTVGHNLSLLKHLDRLATFDLPVLLGHSRKRFLGEIAGIPVEADRDAVTAVSAALCLGKMAIVRVHNVAVTRQVLLVAEALGKAA